MVEEKFMAMHVIWHDENDPKQDEYMPDYQPIDKVEYEL
jgi:hypothetical protein